MTSLIVAMTKDRVIGKNNDLPWPKIRADMKHFRDTTTGHAVIMGRKTWDSIPETYRPLPDRTNIVVSRQTNLQLPGTHHIFNELDVAIEFAKTIDSEPFIIGGAAIYEAALPFTDKIYLTLVKGGYRGDAYFPEIDFTVWHKETLKETEKADFYLLKRN